MKKKRNFGSQDQETTGNKNQPSKPSMDIAITKQMRIWSVVKAEKNPNQIENFNKCHFSQSNAGNSFFSEVRSTEFRNTASGSRHHIKKKKLI